MSLNNDSERGKRIGQEMSPNSESDTWNQIDVSESYLVCGMFEEAASLVFSIVRQIQTATFEIVDETQLSEMMESAGMVFVQSLKELGRTSDLFIELESLFGSVAEIPVQVFLTGACMQISEGLSLNIRVIFEEFLEKWTYAEGEVYILPKEKRWISSSEGNIGRATMCAEKYMEVAEVYTVTLLGMILHSYDLAISWTERAELPEEKRQDMLRRLRSSHLATKSSSSQCPGGSPAVSINGSTVSVREGFLKSNKPECSPSEDKARLATLNSILLTVERFSNRINPCLWWFRTARLKFSNVHLILPRGKIMLLCLLMFVTSYILRKRGALLKRIVAKQVSTMRRALIDAWQLAFSVQVNPLAAVQQLPSAPRGSS